MDMQNLAMAVLLGVVEGVTEFLPVSSTGHLILLVDMLGFRGPPGRVFEVVIQFGAIVGVCWVYRGRLLRLVGDPAARSNLHLAVILLLGFLPAAIMGFLAHGFIKTVLFSPLVVSIALIVGGVAIVVIERMPGKASICNLEAIPRSMALKVGLCQAVSMIPGVSRSGATIMGGRLLGLSRGAAAEFSFLLAIPTMLAASSYDLYKNSQEINPEGGLLLATGFTSAMLTAVLSVRWLIAFVSSHSFESFGWYRIVLGGIMLVLLYS